MNYSKNVKRTALEKMLRPGGAAVSDLSREMDIPKETLYTWMRKAKNAGMNGKKSRRKRSNLLEKMAAVLEARSMADEELGRWLREKGLHDVQLKAWEREISEALASAEGHSGREVSLQKENKELKRDLSRKEKALAEMSALLVLKKKLSAILGEEEE